MALPILRRSGTPVPVRRNDSSTNGSMNLVEPWNDFEAMNRLFDSFFASPFSLPSRIRSAGEGLPAELYETADELVAYLPVPGIAPDRFDISASVSSISVRAERMPLLEQAEGVRSHTPMSSWATASGSFSASYDLPVGIEPAKVHAEYKDGVLKIRMPKSEASRPKQVKIQVEQ